MHQTIRAARGAFPLLVAAFAAPAAATANTPESTPQSTPPPAVASAAPTGGASAARPEPPRHVRVLDRRLVSSGTTVTVRLRALAADVRTELRVRGSGRLVASAEGDAGERFRLHGEARHGERLRLIAMRADGAGGEQRRTLGTVIRRKLRPALASWYGPGLFGNRTACGQTLTAGLRGVAHKTLPCGTALTVRYRGRSTQAKVVDRGPFHGGREFDLTQATARAIGFGAVGTVHVSR